MKVLTATLILVFASVFNASAQLDVTVNPIFAVLESYQISVEHTLRDSWSVGVDGSFSKELYNSEGSRYAFLTGKHYFFPTKKSNRLYVNVFAGLIHSTTYEYFYDEFDWSSYEIVEHNQNFGYGFGAGYKFISNKNIIFDVAAGVGRGNEVFPHFKINIGYRFNYKAS
jgi:hypothetical protein